MKSFIIYTGILAELFFIACVPVSRYNALRQQLQVEQQIALEGKASVLAYQQQLASIEKEKEILLQEIKIYETQYKQDNTKDAQIRQLQARVRELEREIQLLRGNRQAVYNKEVEKKQKSSY